jgi:hypothetical protein
MVPVRKPGRPLSTCPHVPGQSCGCAGVTAAIPRKSKCGCASGVGTPTNSTSASSFNGDVPTPVTPPSPARTSFRVQKPGVKPASSRKSSIDAINLERMDSAQLNVLGPGDQTPKPYNMNGNGYMPPPVNGVMPTSFMPSFPNGFGDGYATSLQYAAVTGIQTAVPVPNVARGPEVAQMKSLPPQINGHGRAKSMTAVPISSGSALHNGSLLKQDQQLDERDEDADMDDGEEAAASCCCGGGDSKAPEPKAAKSQIRHAPGPSTSTAAMMSQYQPTLNLAQPIFVGAFPPQISLYTMPQPYGSVAFPLQPAQWQTIAAAYPTVLPQGAFAVPPIMPPMERNLSSSGSGTDTQEDHECGCGEGCQCIGCAAHPYNEATQEYVRSAWSMQKDSRPATAYADTPKLPEKTDAPVASCCGGGSAATHGSGQISKADSPMQAPPTPIDSPSASATSEEQQTLSANDFFFVNYPFTGGGDCGGDTESCPCGDDCQCLGCTIHNTGGLGIPA